MKINKSHFVIYKLLWALWLLLWIVVPYRLIRPLFFDKFIYGKDPKFGYTPMAEGVYSCTAGLNTDGYRDEEFYPKQNNEYLILVIGDSIVYGQGLQTKHRFTNVLETKLNKIKKTQVFNLGKCGTNLYTHFLVAKEFRQKLNPDLIIFIYNENDLLIKQDFHDYFGPKEPEINNNEVVFDITSPEEGKLYYQRVLGTYDEKTLNYQMLLQIVPRLSTDKTLYYLLTTNAGADYLLKIKGIFQKFGLPMIDNFGLYREKYSHVFLKNKGVVISKMEAHPNSLANRMFAERLHQEITQNPEWKF